MASLWEACGSPAADSYLPSSRDRRWLLARRVLRLAIAKYTNHTPNIRSWQALWSVAQGTTPPRSCTWERLCSNVTLANLVAKIKDWKKADQTPCSWNVRWLVDPNTHIATVKRAIILKALMAGKVVCLQETHWTMEAAAIWEGLFPGCRCVQSSARPGPNGGPQGGVAVLFGSMYREVSKEVIVAGCAVRVTLCDGTKEASYASIYLPPDSRVPVLTSIAQHRGWPDGDCYVAGDLNFDYFAPRDDSEVDLRGLAAQVFMHTRTAMVANVTNTRKGRQSESNIDGIAAPVGKAWNLKAQCRWHHGVSDHAWMYTSVSEGVGRTRSCRPESIKTLPEEAFVELKSEFTRAAHMFGIAPRGGAPRPATHQGFGRPLELPPGYGTETIWEDCMEVDDYAPRTSDDIVIPQNSVLACFGRQTFTSISRNWWEKWAKRRPPAKHCVHKELAHIATANGEQQPSDALREILGQYGHEGGPISPGEAQGWQRVMATEQRLDRAVALTGRGGSKVRKHGIPERYRLGRALYKKTHQLSGIYNEHNEWKTEPKDIDQILWESRKDIWGYPGQGADCTGEVLDLYFQDRSTTLPGEPAPSYERIAGVILAAKDSAPGLDGIPYEVMHHGLHFVTHLVGQGHYAASKSGDELDRVLGQNTDLLLWIPKKCDAVRVDGQRPLQLPTCLRRIFSSSIMEIVGPLVEPSFTKFQAAIKGGNCGPNITAAYKHLDTVRTDEWDDGRHPIWEQVLKDAAAPVQAVSQIGAEHVSRDEPAVLFADQNKAFERLLVSYLIEVMDRWGFPLWIKRGLLASVVHRQVASVVGGVKGTPRDILCGLGMGGPASPFLWCLAYDPIVWALHIATKVDTPTYVDDLAALTYGPSKTVEAQLFLIAVGRVAGLYTEPHHCTTLGAPSGIDTATRILRPFGITPRSVGSLGGFTAQGMPARVMRGLIAAQLGPEWAGTARIKTKPCKCKIKTSVVPRHDIEGWRKAMIMSPFGTQAVCSSAQYLGVKVCSKGEARLANPEVWSADAQNTIRRTAWEGPIKKFEERAEDAHDLQLSPGHRAANFNTYLVSLIPYPAQLCLPTKWDCDRLVAAAKKMLPCKWGSSYMLHALGMGGVGLRGAPKCPQVATEACAIISFLKHGMWGPGPLKEQVRRTWEKVVAWARSDPDNEIRPVGFAGRRTTAGRVLAAEEQRQAGLSPGVRNLGAHVYAALWAATCRQKFLNDLIGISVRRTWWETEGQEWVILQRCRTYLTAHYVLKLLSGGVKGTAGTRPTNVRDEHPKQCYRCACSDPTMIKWTWLTPGRMQPGVAWCKECVGDNRFAVGWPHISGQLHDVPARMNKVSRKLAKGQEVRIDRDTFVHAEAEYDPCPLCGTGELSSQHLILWCPAVALAWLRLTGRDDSITHALIATDEPKRGHLDTLAQMLHQVVFLVGALNTRTTMQWTQAANWIVKAVHNRGLMAKTNLLCGAQIDDPLHRSWEEDIRKHSYDPAGAEVCPLWTDNHANLTSKPCRVCNDLYPALLVSSDKPHLFGKGRRPHIMPRLLPVAQCRIRQGQVIGHFVCDEQQARWPVHSKQWFPPPRMVEQRNANAEWRSHQCPLCGTWHNKLVAIKDMRPGQEVTCEANGGFYHGGEFLAPEYEVTFDGGARCIDGRRVAGSGAVLWGPVEHDASRQRLGRIAIALPNQKTAPIAEAWGLKAAARLLHAQRVPRQRRSVRIVGDNLAVIRYGASLGKLAQPHMHAVLDGILDTLNEQGWDCEWVAVRRRYNKEADCVATYAVHQARELLGRGVLDPTEILVTSDDILANPSGSNQAATQWPPAQP